MSRPNENLSLLDVIENLNILVESESLENIEVNGPLFFPHSDEKKGLWVPVGNNEETLEAIKITFKNAYKYLNFFYRKIREEGENPSLLEGINTIMVLIGETRKKFEKIHKLFSANIAQLPEYKDIENFYRSRIIKEIKGDDSSLSDILVPDSESLWDKEFEKLFGTVEREENIRLLNDIETVKKDHLYELFHLKDTTGHPFYSQELARNIKLACDFGKYAEDHYLDDPLIKLSAIHDKHFNVLSCKMLDALKKELHSFYKNAFRHRDIELVMHLHKAVMALMLASNENNLIGKQHPKGCRAYFADFQYFLRKALQDREYQNFSFDASSSLQEKPFFKDLINLIYGFCFHLFKQNTTHHEIVDYISELLGRPESERPLATFLANTFHKLEELLNHHPPGPIFKALDLIREEQIPPFDPIMLGNLAEQDFLLQIGGEKIHLYRSPSPTQQEYVHIAEITEEFKTFLFALSEKQENEHYLIFNLQDRTSWKEHARVQVLEELSRNAFFSDTLTVVTLAKDTDFYLQKGPYRDLSDVHTFISHFLDHLQDQSTGYYFPIPIRQNLFGDFALNLLNLIHGEIFEKKKELTFHQRLDFIELAYLLIELKIIEIIKPTIVSHLSKDGLDVAATATIAFIALLSKGKKSVEEWQGSLFGSTLLMRERATHPERFERLLSLLVLLENKDLKKISSLFSHATWQTSVL